MNEEDVVDRLPADYSAKRGVGKIDQASCKESYLVIGGTGFLVEGLYNGGTFRVLELERSKNIHFVHYRTNLSY